MQSESQNIEYKESWRDEYAYTYDEKDDCYVEAKKIAEVTKKKLEYYKQNNNF